MENETPIKVIKNDAPNAHKTETRIFAREIHETFCDEPECKFYGKHAAPGLCYSWEEEGDEGIWKRIERKEVLLNEEWAEFYAKSPEDARSAYITAMLNWDLGIIETIRLRKENAELKLKLGLYE